LLFTLSLTNQLNIIVFSENIVCLFLKKNNITYYFQIDCGAQVSVLKNDVSDVETSSEKFPSRVRGLCELFWPQRVHLMRLTVDPKADSESELIKECHIDAMTSM
jgi:hypothetical protein